MQSNHMQCLLPIISIFSNTTQSVEDQLLWIIQWETCCNSICSSSYWCITNSKTFHCGYCQILLLNDSARRRTKQQVTNGAAQEVKLLECWCSYAASRPRHRAALLQPSVVVRIVAPATAGLLAHDAGGDGYAIRKSFQELLWKWQTT